MASSGDLGNERRRHARPQTRPRSLFSQDTSTFLPGPSMPWDERRSALPWQARRPRRSAFESFDEAQWISGVRDHLRAALAGPPQPASDIPWIHDRQRPLTLLSSDDEQEHEMEQDPRAKAHLSLTADAMEEVLALGGIVDQDEQRPVHLDGFAEQVWRVDTPSSSQAPSSLLSAFQRDTTGTVDFDALLQFRARMAQGPSSKPNIQVLDPNADPQDTLMHAGEDASMDVQTSLTDSLLSLDPHTEPMAQRLPDLPTSPILVSSDSDHEPDQSAWLHDAHDPRMHHETGRDLQEEDEEESDDEEEDEECKDEQDDEEGKEDDEIEEEGEDESEENVDKEEENDEEEEENEDEQDDDKEEEESKDKQDDEEGDDDQEEDEKEYDEKTKDGTEAEEQDKDGKSQDIEDSDPSAAAPKDETDAAHDRECIAKDRPEDAASGKGDLADAVNPMMLSRTDDDILPTPPKSPLTTRSSCPFQRLTLSKHTGAPTFIVRSCTLDPHVLEEEGAEQDDVLFDGLDMEPLDPDTLPEPVYHTLRRIVGPSMLDDVYVTPCPTSESAPGTIRKRPRRSSPTAPLQMRLRTPEERRPPRHYSPDL